MHGVLYQGYWPESLLTPPDDGAIERDLRQIKACGFNTVRVHAVVMGKNFYHLCDQLGLMVWQDMPSGDMRALPVWSDGRAFAEEMMGGASHRLDEITRNPESKAVFQKELKAMLKYLAPYPCVVVWVLFNEGWGQANTEETVDLVKQIDGHSRLVDAVSGWNDLGLGDFVDIHNYEDNSSIYGPLPESFPNYATWGYNVSGPRLKRRGTMHIVRRAETQIDQMEPTWFDKLRRACGLQRFDVVARIAMSLKDVETAMEMIHALAFECFKQRSSFLRAILREFRLLNVSPDLAVELFRNTEQWFRAQSPRIAEWNEILYALVLANHYEEAWELVTSMEKGLDPRLPVPLSSTYSILFMLTAQHEGPSATAQLFARQRHIVGASRNPLQHLIMAAIYVSADNPNLDMAKKHVRQGERLMRQLRSCPEPFKENKYLLEYLYATLMAGYRRLARLQDCFTLFGVMQQHAGQPNQVVFAILQQACWGHLDATSEVRQILRLMEDMQVQPGTVNYNALIKTHSDSGQFTNALSVANRLREAGVAWDDFTYRYLLLAAVGAGQVELGVRLLSQMRSDGVRPSSKQYITVHTM
eukprot:symbB.v1.2.018493.t1/scaffold1477.1/size133841/7